MWGLGIGLLADLGPSRDSLDEACLGRWIQSCLWPLTVQGNQTFSLADERLSYIEFDLASAELNFVNSQISGCENTLCSTNNNRRV